MREVLWISLLIYDDRRRMYSFNNRPDKYYRTITTSSYALINSFSGIYFFQTKNTC